MNEEKKPNKFEPEVFEKVEIFNFNFQIIKIYHIFFSVTILFFFLSLLSMRNYYSTEASMQTNFCSIWGIGFLLSGVLSYYLKRFRELDN